MTTHTALLASPTKARPSARMIAPVLIQVPALSARDRHSQRPSARRGRRRIRREVRVVASTMLFALPMSWALLGFAKVGSGPARPISAAPIAVADAPVSFEDGPRVTLSLEPSAVIEPTERDGPMAHPAGYLVPDHGSEETAHAGH